MCQRTIKCSSEWCILVLIKTMYQSIPRPMSHTPKYVEIFFAVMYFMQVICSVCINMCIYVVYILVSARPSVCPTLILSNDGRFVVRSGKCKTRPSDEATPEELLIFLLRKLGTGCLKTLRLGIYIIILFLQNVAS